MARTIFGSVSCANCGAVVVSLFHSLLLIHHDGRVGDTHAKLLGARELQWCKLFYFLNLSVQSVHHRLQRRRRGEDEGFLRARAHNYRRTSNRYKTIYMYIE